MVAATGEDVVDRSFVRLQASIRASAGSAHIADILAGNAGRWLSGAEPLPKAGPLRRYAVDLRLRVGRDEAGLTTFRKAALLDLGPVRRIGSRAEVEISWRAASAAPLFPVFSGWLIAEPGEVRIEGIYAPPGGAVGRIADRLLLHTAANATARWLLQALDDAARTPRT
jgi:hypothetical protein